MITNKTKIITKLKKISEQMAGKTISHSLAIDKINKIVTELEKEE